MRAIIIANGPSLTAEDVDACRGKGLVIVVNDAYRLAPWADVLYACDDDWWDLHIGQTADFAGSKWCGGDEAARKHGLRHVSVRSDMVWSATLGCVASGGNSGFQAINLAYLWGYREIVLLGFDYAKGEDGEEHWFGAHPGALRKASPYRDWLKRIRQAKPKMDEVGLRVVNCSRRTAIDCFQRSTIAEAL